MQKLITTILVAGSLLVGCGGCQLPVLVQAQECPQAPPMPICDLVGVELMDEAPMEVWLCDGGIVVLRPARDHRAL